MASTDAQQRTARNALLALCALGALGMILTALAVSWFIRNARPPSVPATTRVEVQPSDAFLRYRSEIGTTAERSLETLHASTRAKAVASRPNIAPNAFARRVDGYVRQHTAMEVVEAFFNDDLGPLTASGTVRLRETLRTARWTELRDRLGPIFECKPFKSGTCSTWEETVTGYVTLDADFDDGAAAEVKVDLIYQGRGAWHVDAFAVLPYPPGKSRTPTRHSDWGIDRESCRARACGAIRYRQEGRAWKSVPGRSDHAHEWKKGASGAILEPVPEGVLVLISRAPFVVGVILRRVSIDAWGECDYDWAYRDDGGTSLDPSDPAVRTGRASGSRRIDVAGVRIGWTPESAGKAWLYYPRHAGQQIVDEDPRICVTSLHGFAGVDVAAPRFRFRASPSDEGAPHR